VKVITYSLQSHNFLIARCWAES